MNASCPALCPLCGCYTGIMRIELAGRLTDICDTCGTTWPTIPNTFLGTSPEVFDDDGINVKIGVWDEPDVSGN